MTEFRRRGSIMRMATVSAAAALLFTDSQNCRDEMSFARDLEKERLLIYGEKEAL